ncbi:unnamed protein product [Rotaria sp. Silwood1]|nr:unnamed protein product [Rotaria sp. Silwood1]
MIAASDSRSTGRFSSIIQANPQLAQPHNFKAVTGHESASTNLSWVSVVGATGYEIQRSPSYYFLSVFTTVATISNGSTTNYIDKSNLINGQTYYYKIAASDSPSTGRFSSIIQAKPQLAQPGNFKAVTGHESASVNLSWVSVVGATGYEIQRSLDSSFISKFTTVATISNGSATNYIDKSNLINGQTYYYTIAARDSRCTGRYSPIIQANPQLAPPDNFKAVTGHESASIDLSWKRVVGATGYEIQRSSTNNYGAIFNRIAIISKTSTSNYIDKSNLINGQTYYYKIAANDGQSAGRFSPVINATAHVCPPFHLQVVPIYGSCAVFLRWGVIKEATGYYIKRSSTASTIPVEIIKTVSNGSVCSYVDQELTDGCCYYYIMTSKDGEDESVYTSNVVSVVSSVNEPSTSAEALSEEDKGADFGSSYQFNIILDRFSLEILPKINDKIERLSIESSFIKRILLVTNYPNLHALDLYDFEPETASTLFRQATTQFKILFANP